MNLDTLVAQVGVEVTHLANGSPAASDEYRQQAAVSVIARVPVLLSSAIYSSHLAGGTAPTTQASAFAMGAGICGHHVALAVEVLQALSVPVRDVQVFYRDGGLVLDHTFIEVEWGDAWRMIDTTWGFIPYEGSLASALSFEEAALANHREGLHHPAIPWRRAVEDAYDIFGYLSCPRDGLFHDGSGAMAVDVTEGEVAFPHPQRIYRAGSWDHRAGVSGQGRLQVRVPEGTWSVAVDASASAPGTITAGDLVRTVPVGSVRFELAVRGPTDLDVAFESETPHASLSVGALGATRNDSRDY